MQAVNSHKPQSGLYPAHSDAFDDHDIKRNQEHIGHRQPTKDIQHRLDPGRGEPEMHHRKPDRLGIWREQRQRSDHQRGAQRPCPRAPQGRRAR